MARGHTHDPGSVTPSLLVSDLFSTATTGLPPPVSVHKSSVKPLSLLLSLSSSAWALFPDFQAFLSVRSVQDSSSAMGNGGVSGFSRLNQSLTVFRADCTCSCQGLPVVSHMQGMRHNMVLLAQRENMLNEICSRELVAPQRGG